MIRFGIFAAALAVLAAPAAATPLADALSDPAPITEPGILRVVSDVGEAVEKHAWFFRVAGDPAWAKTSLADPSHTAAWRAMMVQVADEVDVAIFAGESFAAAAPRVVNAAINARMIYRDDPTEFFKFGVSSVTPPFAALDGGDCEDIALAKLQALHELGFSGHLQMAIVRIPRSTSLHAVAIAGDTVLDINEPYVIRVGEDTFAEAVAVIEPFGPVQQAAR